MNRPAVRIAPAPHNPANIPKTCWTCLNRKIVLSGMTTCPHIDTYNHVKVGIEPCEKYDLDARWIVVDWAYIGGVKE